MTTLRDTIFACCAGACLWTAACQRPAATDEVRGEVGAAALTALALPLDPVLRTQVLDSGVAYFARSHPATVQRVVLALVVKAGALVEAEDERGLAHFVEHMAFDGTTHYDSQRLRTFFGHVGMELGTHANASTTRTSTLYQLEVPSDEPATLDEAVLILADWATGMLLEPEAVERVRPVLLAEKRVQSGAQQRVSERLMKVVMQGSRYADRDPIGLDSVLQSATAERLRSFYRRWYQPQNLAVVATGNFDMAAMQRRVEQRFGSLPKAESPSTPPRFEVPVLATEHFTVDSDPELSSSLCVLALKRQARPRVTEEDYRRQIRDGLVQWMLQRRLEALPREADTPLASAGTSFGVGEGSAYDALQLRAEPRREQEGRALGRLLAELERVAQHGFLAAELERARPVLAAEWAASLMKGRPLRDDALQLAERFLAGNAVLARANEVDLSQRLLANISLDELNQHATRWVRQSERHYIVVGRDAGALPSEAALRAVAADVRNAPLGPYTEATRGAPLMAARPPIGRIASERHIAAINTYEWILPNGARVLFKPTDADGSKISLRAFSPGGTARGRRADFPGLRFTARLISALGLGSHSAASTQQLLINAGVRVTPWIEDYEEGLDASGPVEHLDSLFQALHLTLSAPGSDAAAWEASKNRIRERLTSSSASPDTSLTAAIIAQARGDAPRFGRPPPEAVDQLRLDALRAFYLERLGDVGDFTFVFVGDAEPGTLKSLVEQYLASLPGTPRREATSAAEAYYRPGVTRVRVQQGHADKGTISVLFHDDERLPSSAREELRTLRDYLKTRLLERLREELGGVYSVQVWAELREPPRQGHEVGFRFDCRPDQCESLKQAAFAVISDIQRAGAPPDHVAVLRSQLARSAEVVPQKAEFWQEELSNAYRRGLDPAEILATFSNGERISSAALRASARRYLRVEQYVDALLLPEGSAGTAAPPDARSQR